MDPSKGSNKKSSYSTPKSSGSPTKKPSKDSSSSKSSPEHESKQLWQAKQQVLNMPSPRREYREVTVDTSRSSGDPLCCGVRQDGSTSNKDKEGFSRVAVLYFVCFSCVFVVAVIGLRMFSIEDKLLRLDTDYQQQQMRIEALEDMMHQMKKDYQKQILHLQKGSSTSTSDYFKRTKRETAECICPPG
ncbi:hypothetical protein JTE90_009635 [Oedothorax gibbosus]|uniref:Uncharacterized protein n=1 Tax=Oedothorax gibbosus TaxID=931172 RepID=A0AAV6V9J1_9ARAC|nr:hypothetical protein JTE90_009635 [Oedothorax gibbosus]